MNIPKRPFGQTGHMSSAVIFGAAALWDTNQKTADQTLELLLEFGINHIDVAPRYGSAEQRIGPWMREFRKNFFLATKTAERTYKKAKEELYRSLEYLQTDHLDLIQLHSLTHPDEWDTVFTPNGALEALIEAQEAGLVRCLGVTGHGWTAAAMHYRSLQQFQFDSVLLPWNWFAAHHRNYPFEFEKLLSFCKTNKIAVQTIKSVARGAWAAGTKKTHTTWYQPIEDKYSISQAVRWVLARPEIFLNSTGDLKILPIILEAASNLRHCPSNEEMNLMSKKLGLSTIFGL
jgi:aryl-alcohol dehydrogenase-like predicted oxidoreductase